MKDKTQEQQTQQQPMLFGKRIQKERKRLHMSQKQLASVSGIGHITQMHYEKDKFPPKLEYLIQLQNLGIDILYIITGERTMSLSKTEQKLINDFRLLNPKQQTELLRTINSPQNKGENYCSLVVRNLGVQNSNVRSINIGIPTNWQNYKNQSR